MDIKILLLIGAIVLIGVFAIYESFLLEEEYVAVTDEEPLISGVLNIYNWEDYLSEELIGDFEKKYGVTVNLDYFEDSDDVLVSLRQSPGKYDIFITDDDYVEYFAKLRLLKKIDHQKIPNLKNIKEDALIGSVDEKMEYCVPYTSGYTAVVINNNDIKNYDGSRDIFWNEEYKGKITMPNNAMEILVSAVYYLGYNPKDINYEQLLEAEEKALELEEMDILFGDPVQQRDWLVDEEAIIGYVYSTEVVFIQEDNESIDFFAPQEGAYLWSDWICMSKDVNNFELVHLFLNYLYETENMAKNSEDIYSIMPGKNVEDYIDDEILELVDGLDFPKDKEILKKSVRINYSLWDEAQDVLSNITRELKIRE